MTRQKAGEVVARAFNAAKVSEAAHDPAMTHATVEIDGHEATHEFTHKRPSERMDEVTRWRLALVEELSATTKHLKPKAEEPEPEPEEEEEVLDLGVDDEAAPGFDEPGDDDDDSGVKA